ncbi:MAG: hypothetical protein BZY87_04365 [SAR202 cluster bacterium Io17-Chloro-G6]|nr:MAG: hypothetical protein BZY87_04365 [SAR202 cluster bacterium Io17-Chloro-G6]
MNIEMTDGTAYPLTWEEYECLALRVAEDPNVAIGFRPAAWGTYARQFFSGTEDDGAFGEDVLADMTIPGAFFI